MWIRSALVAAGIVGLAAAFSAAATAQIKGPTSKTGPGTVPPIIRDPPPGITLPEIKPTPPPPSVILPPGAGGGGGPPPPVTGVPGGCTTNCPVTEPDEVERAMRMGIAVIELYEQIRYIEQITGYDQRSRVETTLKVLATHWLVPLPRAADAVQRDAVIKQARSQLEGLLQKTLTDTIALMVDDVRRLRPYAWNPFAGTRRAELERWEREILDTGKRAQGELANPGTFHEIRAQKPPRGAIEFRPGKAIQQLQQINRTGRWRNQ